MNLTCIRFEYGTTYTIGRLFIDSIYECFTLEDKVREPGIKIPGKTAIPEGTYRVILDYSPKYNRNMLHILDVPAFKGVRIHSGNTDEDTEGCLLVGKTWNGNNTIYGSRDAYLKLIVQVSVALDNKEPVFLKIIDTDKA